MRLQIFNFDENVVSWHFSIGIKGVQGVSWLWGGWEVASSEFWDDDDGWVIRRWGVSVWKIVCSMRFNFYKISLMSSFWYCWPFKQDRSSFCTSWLWNGESLFWTWDFIEQMILTSSDVVKNAVIKKRWIEKEHDERVIRKWDMIARSLRHRLGDLFYFYFILYYFFTWMLIILF